VQVASCQKQRLETSFSLSSAIVQLGSATRSYRYSLPLTLPTPRSCTRPPSCVARRLMGSMVGKPGALKKRCGSPGFINLCRRPSPTVKPCTITLVFLSTNTAGGGVLKPREKLASAAFVLPTCWCVCFVVFACVWMCVVRARCVGGGEGDVRRRREKKCPFPKRYFSVFFPPPKVTKDWVNDDGRRRRTADRRERRLLAWRRGADMFVFVPTSDTQPTRALLCQPPRASINWNAELELGFFFGSRSACKF
jgi:hypothetical protein